MAIPRISAAESQVMQALWARGPLGAEDLVAEVAPANGWGEATVRTLVARLIKKKAVASEKRGGRTLYAPLVSREAYITAEGQSLLDRLFGGQVAPMVAHFTREKALSPEDVARLRRLLAEMDRDEED